MIIKSTISCPIFRHCWMWFSNFEGVLNLKSKVEMCGNGILKWIGSNVVIFITGGICFVFCLLREGCLFWPKAQLGRGFRDLIVVGILGWIRLVGLETRLIPYQHGPYRTCHPYHLYRPCHPYHQRWWTYRRTCHPLPYRPYRPSSWWPFVHHHHHHRVQRMG